MVVIGVGICIAGVCFAGQPVEIVVGESDVVAIGGICSGSVPVIVISVVGLITYGVDFLHEQVAVVISVGVSVAGRVGHSREIAQGIVGVKRYSDRGCNACQAVEFIVFVVVFLSVWVGDFGQVGVPIPFIKKGISQRVAL